MFRNEISASDDTSMHLMPKNWSTFHLQLNLIAIDRRIQKFHLTPVISERNVQTQGCLFYYLLHKVHATLKHTNG